MRNPFKNSYEKLAASPDYKKVEWMLRLIKWSVYVLSGVSTAFVNGLSHASVIGLWPAIGLGVLTFAIVELSLIAIEKGLQTCFKGGSQRTWAWLTKILLKATMVCNAGWVAWHINGGSPPYWLDFWAHWSFVVHFGAGLILVPIIHDADPVVQNRMLELRAETSQTDQIILRLSAAIGSPFALMGAKLRGALDGLALGWNLLWNKEGFDGQKYIANLNSESRKNFAYVEGNRQIGPGSNLASSSSAVSGPAPGTVSGNARSSNFYTGDPRGN